MRRYGASFVAIKDVSMSESAAQRLTAKVLGIRRYASSVLADLLLSGFATHLWLLYMYVGSCPREPDPARGFIYPLNNHGTYSYMNATDTMSMKLAYLHYLPTLRILIIVMPKPTVVRTTMGSVKGYQVSRMEATRSDFATFWLTVVAYLGAACFLGSSIVAFALRSGLSPT